MSTNVHAIIQTLTSGLKELESHLDHLNTLFGGWEKTSPGGRKASARAARKRRRRAARTPRPSREAAKRGVAAKKRKKPTISAALRAQRRLQGKYMALFRRLPKARQAAVRKVREAKGYPAALKMMG